MKNRSLFIAFLVFLHLATTVARDELGAIDSLIKQIGTHQTDTGTAKACVALATLLYLSNQDTVIPLCEKARAICEAGIKDRSVKGKELEVFQKTLGQALGNIGFIYDVRGDVEKGLEYYQSALKIHEKQGDLKEMAAMYNNIGYVYNSYGDIPKALSYYHKALTLREQTGDIKGAGYTLNNIAVIYIRQDEPEKAVETYRKALDLFKSIDHKDGMSMIFNNLGAFYDDRDELEKALTHYKSSLEIEERERSEPGVATSLNNIGFVYHKMNKPEEAEAYYLKSILIKRKLKNKYGLATSFRNMATINQERGDLRNAKLYADSALGLAKEIGDASQIRDAAALLWRFHKEMANTPGYKPGVNWEKALEMYEVCIKMRDSLKNEETQKATIRQQTRYEFEKAQLVKEQEEKERLRQLASTVSRRNNLQYSVVLLVLILLFSSIIVVIPSLTKGRRGISLSIPPRLLEGLIFFAFLILFEFLLVLADPYIESWSGGAPGIKLLFNAGVAALIFPLHSFFEGKLKQKLVKGT